MPLRNFRRLLDGLIICKAYLVNGWKTLVKFWEDGIKFTIWKVTLAIDKLKYELAEQEAQMTMFWGHLCWYRARYWAQQYSKGRHHSYGASGRPRGGIATGPEDHRRAGGRYVTRYLLIFPVLDVTFSFPLFKRSPYFVGSDLILTTRSIFILLTSSHVRFYFYTHLWTFYFVWCFINYRGIEIWRIYGMEPGIK